MVERRLGRPERINPLEVAAVQARTARICRLLEGAVHEGERALALLARARTLYGHAQADDPVARARELRGLADQLLEVQRTGRRRLREARMLLQPTTRLRLVRP